MSRLQDAHYIDTRPGRQNAFSPPAPVEDYKAWLINRYNNSTNENGYAYGVAQKIHGMISQHKKAITDQQTNIVVIMTHGPYAGAAAEAIIEISKGMLDVDVLG